MSNRRLIPLGLGAVALLAIVALAARGGSLHSGGSASGSGPSTAFWSYFFTTLLALEILVVLGAIWVATGLRPNIRADAGARRAAGRRTVRNLMILIAFSAVLFYVLLLFHGHNGGKTPRLPNVPPPKGLPDKKHDSRQLALKWEELVVVLALVAAVGAAYVVYRKRLVQPPQQLGTAPETVAAALDESLDDLRSDPDLRRAIVAAYARMERTLAVVGLPRDPAEAPLEYLERVLRSLDASADAVRSLTDLFEWAKFSHHEPEPSMRDEAVDALVTVRDELLNAERQVA